MWVTLQEGNWEAFRVTLLRATERWRLGPQQLHRGSGLGSTEMVMMMVMMIIEFNTNKEESLGA